MDHELFYLARDDKNLREQHARECQTIGAPYVDEVLYDEDLSIKAQDLGNLVELGVMKPAQAERSLADSREFLMETLLYPYTCGRKTPATILLYKDAYILPFERFRSVFEDFYVHVARLHYESITLTDGLTIDHSNVRQISSVTYGSIMQILGLNNQFLQAAVRGTRDQVLLEKLSNWITEANVALQSIKPVSEFEKKVLHSMRVY
jgi:hypothetical protein